jgi:hypothetical protein
MHNAGDCQRLYGATCCNNCKQQPCLPDKENAAFVYYETCRRRLLAAEHIRANLRCLSRYACKESDRSRYLQPINRVMRLYRRLRAAFVPHVTLQRALYLEWRTSHRVPRMVRVNEQSSQKPPLCTLWIQRCGTTGDNGVHKSISLAGRSLRQKKRRKFDFFRPWEHSYIVSILAYRHSSLCEIQWHIGIGVEEVSPLVMDVHERLRGSCSTYKKLTQIHRLRHLALTLLFRLGHLSL